MVRWTVRVACVLLPRFPLDLALAAQPKLPGRPLAVMANASSPMRVVEAAVVAARSPQAGRTRARPGMPHEALARCPDAALQMLPVRQGAEAAARMQAALAQFSPLLEGAEPGCVFVGLDGLPEAGEPAAELALAHRLQRAVRSALGLTPRVGVADSRVAARAAAWLAPPSLTGQIPLIPEPACAVSGPCRVVVAPGAAATAAFLAPLPVHWLVRSPALQERLAWLGIRTVSALATLSKGALLAQFGPEGGRLWDLAHGHDPDGPIPPDRPPPQLSDHLAFPQPITGQAALHAGLRFLLTRLLTAPESAGRSARAATLTVTLETGLQQRWAVTFHAPTRDPEHLHRVLAARLGRVPLSAAVTELALTLHGLCREVGVQASLFTTPTRLRQGLAATLAQLRARFGRPVILQIVEVEPWSRIPERRYALVPAELGLS